MKKYTHTLIFLHGFTMKPKEVEYYINKIDNILPKEVTMKYILPKAPERKITIYNKKYPAWFDYLTNNCMEKENINEKQLIQSRKRLHNMIDKEIKYHNDPKKIFIAGYSQGSSMALDIGITYPKKLGGIIGFKGDIPNITDKDRHKQDIWVCHGKKDDTIGYDITKESYDKYKKFKYNITFLSQNVDHELNTGINEQMKSLKKWIKKYI